MVLGPKFTKYDRNFSSALRLLFEIAWVFAKSCPIFAVTFYKKLFPGKGKDVRGKIVLITGAGNGLGKELSLQFAKLGSRVICVDIREQDNEETVREIKEQTGDDSRAESFVCDVSDHEAVEALKETILQEYEHVDILINNAGVVYGNTIFTGEVDDIKRVLDINLMSSYWMTRAFVPSMKKREEGHIVFINSMASLTPLGGGVMYCVSKLGMLGLSMSLLDDFRKDPALENIKISSAHPYFINTGNWYSDHLFDIRFRPLRTEVAARLIVSGIRRELEHFQVPGYETGFWFTSLLRLLPTRVFHMLRDIIYSDIVIFKPETGYGNLPAKIQDD